ncbi:MAG: SurA N-terminal domain-containing protein [Candidatus Nomurabacteria bacterium]|nr:MAG: SurA N-terminal domain-containing protein [Candidatus Nomurabacteria bacterium]
MEEDKKRVEEEVSTGETRVDETPVAGSEDKADSSSVTKASSKGKGILISTIIAVIVLAIGLVFMLERDGRINTGLFTGVISYLDAREPVAKVNGAVIPKSDLDSGVQQLVEMAKLQGIEADEAAIAEFRSQAIETLVNGELLRQEAVEKGMTASVEDIDARYSEIEDGVGGAETLGVKMAEFGITEESLRRDIENEILIQALFDTVVNKDEIEVTEDEITDFYNQSGGLEAGLPEIDEVKDQIVDQLKFNKEQEVIGTYIDDLREGAEIEILI